MKRGRTIAILLAGMISACTIVWYLQETYWERKDQLAASQRQLVYRSIVQSYKASLSNRMTRAQVEGYLRNKGVQFNSICCLDQSGSNAEITKIGYETGPWYCNGYEVYVGFKFRGPLSSQDPLDTLKEISVVTLPDNCL